MWFASNLVDFGALCCVANDPRSECFRRQLSRDLASARADWSDSAANVSNVLGQLRASNEQWRTGRKMSPRAGAAAAAAAVGGGGAGAFTASPIATGVDRS